MIMTHLYIEQDNTRIEEVDNSVINKLYELASSGNLDNTSDLKGRLHTVSTKELYVTYLTQNFSQLYIQADILYMQFADPEVERVLSTLWGDGEGLTFQQTQSYNKIPSNTFNNNTTIESFDELSRLTSITELGQSCFRSASNLRSIDLSNIEVLGPSCFQNCSNLQTINLQYVQTIDAGAFHSAKLSQLELNCPALKIISYNVFCGCELKKVVNLGQITQLPENTFSSCSKLESVNLPNTCLTIGDDCFFGTTKLKEINLENIQTIGSEVFANSGLYNSQIQPVIYFKELANLIQNGNAPKNGLFAGLSSYVYSPKLIQIKGGWDKGGNDCRGIAIRAGWTNSRTNFNIVYFKDLATVETGCFCGGMIRNLVVNNSTPPTVNRYSGYKQDLLLDISSNGTSVVQNVWVPDSAVNDYKNHQYWREFGNKIQGISNMSKVATRTLWDQLSSNDQKDTLIEEYM